MREIGKHFNRAKELMCVIFGHNWSIHGTEQGSETKEILHEYNECARCGLEKHDRSGYVRKFQKERKI